MTTVFQCREFLSCVVYLEESLACLGCAESVRTDESAWTVSTFQKVLSLQRVPRVWTLYSLPGFSSVWGVISVHSASTVYNLQRVCIVCCVYSASLSPTLALQWLKRLQRESTTRRAHTLFFKSPGRTTDPTPLPPLSGLQASTLSNVSRVFQVVGASKECPESRVGPRHQGWQRCLQCLTRVRPCRGHESVSRVSRLSEVFRVSRVRVPQTPRVSTLSKVSGVF